MDVKPGYKQTEVGVIPREWQCAPISDIARLESGHTPSKREPSYWGGSVPWVSLHDSENLEGREILTTAQTITPEGLNNSSARLLPQGTVVFSRTATVGKATTLGREMATSQDFVAYVCGPQLHNHFLVYLLRSMRRTWQSLMAGSIHNTIYMPVFKALRIVLPPISEQRAIAEALSDVDALLDGLERLLAKKRDLRLAAMQQLLTGQTRLPGFHGEWEVKRLGDVCKIQKGELITEATAILGEVPVVAGGQKPSYFHNVPNRTGKTITISGSGAYAGFVSFFDFPIFASDCSTISESPHYSIEFLYYQLVLRQGDIYRSQTGGAQPHVHPSDIAPLFLHVPDNVLEQTSIAAALSDMDAELAALELRRDKTCDLRQAMMQELLTGKTRLVSSGVAHA